MQLLRRCATGEVTHQPKGISKLTTMQILFKVVHERFDMNEYLVVYVLQMVAFRISRHQGESIGL